MIKISKPIIGYNGEFRRTSMLAINNDYFLEKYIDSTKLQQELNDYIDDTDYVIDDEINYNPFFYFCNKKK